MEYDDDMVRVGIKTDRAMRHAQHCRIFWGNVMQVHGEE